MKDGVSNDSIKPHQVAGRYVGGDEEAHCLGSLSISIKEYFQWIN